MFIGKIVVNPCSFFWRCGWRHLLLWNIWNLEQICYRNLPKRWQNRTKGVPGEAQIGPRDTPRSSEKLVAKKTRQGRKPSRKWFQNGSHNLKIWNICSYLFLGFFVFFVGCFLNIFLIILGSFLASFLWCFWICSKIVSKLAYLCKCTRHPHGNMVFEVLAPCILIIFSWFFDKFPC